MTAFHFAVPAGCLAVLLSTTGALAQVTAQQVWDDWKSSMGIYGADGITIGSESYAGGVLTVTDLGFSLSDDEGATVSGNLPQLVLTEQADGTVAVTMSETYPISFSAADEYGSSTEVDMSLHHTGLSMTVSGSPGNLTYAMSVPRYELVVDTMVVDGEDVPLDAVIGMNNMTGSYTTSGPAELRNIAYDLAVESVDIKAAVAGPNASDGASLNGTIAGISGQTSMTLPADLDQIDPAAIFASGFAMDAAQTMGAMQLDYTFSDAGEAVQGAVSMTGGSVAAAISQAALDYAFAFQGVSVETAGSAMPFPVTFSASELGIALAMPMSQTETPADFAGRLNLAGVTVNEEIWAMLDPGAIIPRDPATVTVDLTGTARLLVDLTAPDTAGMAEMEAPGELHSLNVNDITVRFGGADVHAAGSFTFDNSDMTTFPGMPRPIGKIDVALNGVNGLVQKLVQIGLVPAEQVMGVTMMLGMFSVPVGDDQLTSTIEFTADGQLLANGQRLQ